jgi:hypothetical protein
MTEPNLGVVTAQEEVMNGKSHQEAAQIFEKLKQDQELQAPPLENIMSEPPPARWEHDSDISHEMATKTFRKRKRAKELQAALKRVFPPFLLLPHPPLPSLPPSLLRELLFPSKPTTNHTQQTMHTHH